MVAAMDVDMPQQVGDFRLIVDDELEFAKGIRIAKWQSESTGLKVVYGSNESERSAMRPFRPNPC